MSSVEALLGLAGVAFYIALVYEFGARMKGEAEKKDVRSRKKRNGNGKV